MIFGKTRENFNIGLNNVTTEFRNPYFKSNSCSSCVALKGDGSCMLDKSSAPRITSEVNVESCLQVTNNYYSRVHVTITGAIVKIIARTGNGETEGFVYLAIINDLLFRIYFKVEEDKTINIRIVRCSLIEAKELETVKEFTYEENKDSATGIGFTVFLMRLYGFLVVYCMENISDPE